MSEFVSNLKQVISFLWICLYLSSPCVQSCLQTLKCHHYFAVRLIVVSWQTVLLTESTLPPLQYTRYETLPFATDYCSYYVPATPTVRLNIAKYVVAYIKHRNCIHVRTFHLRGGLVGDAVVVSLSKKEQVYVSLIHWKTVPMKLQYCLILNHKKLLYVTFSHFPKIPS